MSDLNPQRIYWHSRRGMLELDLLLMPFAREAFPNLSERDKQLYSDLLEQEDQDLWSWLMDRGEPSQPGFKSIIALILAHNQKPV